MINYVVVAFGTTCSYPAKSKIGRPDRMFGVVDDESMERDAGPCQNPGLVQPDPDGDVPLRATATNGRSTLAVSCDQVL